MTLTNFFKKKVSPRNVEPKQAWSFLKADMHAHFIPGIDDGCESIEESLELLSEMEQFGFTKICTTPHISFDYYPNTEAKILEALELLKMEVKKAGLNLEIEAGAEYMIDETFMHKLATKQDLLYFGDKYVLIEMGFALVSPFLMQAIFELQALGYKPVLAHPERYSFYISNSLDELQTLKDVGCLFQLNTIALSGYYGKPIKQFAEKILKVAMYDFAGTDIHHTRHVQALGAVLREPVYENLINYSFLNGSL